MKTKAMKKFYLGAVVTASLGMLGSAVSADPIVSYEGDACVGACIDFGSQGFLVSGGGLVKPSVSVSQSYRTPGEFTGNDGNVLSYNVVSTKDEPEGANSVMTVSGLSNAFELYWGSIDTYNEIWFYDGLTKVGQYTGTQAGAAASASVNPNGGFDTDGYFSFMGTPDYMFDSVELRSTGVAFEVATAIPEPGTMALLGLGLAGLGAARRRKVAA